MTIQTKQEPSRAPDPPSCPLDREDKCLDETTLLEVLDSVFPKGDLLWAILVVAAMVSMLVALFVTDRSSFFKMSLLPMTMSLLIGLCIQFVGAPDFRIRDGARLFTVCLAVAIVIWTGWILFMEKVCPQSASIRAYANSVGPSSVSATGKPTPAVDNFVYAATKPAVTSVTITETAIEYATATATMTTYTNMYISTTMKTAKMTTSTPKSSTTTQDTGEQHAIRSEGHPSYPCFCWED